MKVKMCSESFCHYDPNEVDEVLTCNECPYQIEIEEEELGDSDNEEAKLCCLYSAYDVGSR